MGDHRSDSAQQKLSIKHKVLGTVCAETLPQDRTVGKGDKIALEAVDAFSHLPTGTCEELGKLPPATYEKIALACEGLTKKGTTIMPEESVNTTIESIDKANGLPTGACAALGNVSSRTPSH